MNITGRFKRFIYSSLVLMCASTAMSQAVECPPNIDFEFGNFSNWKCYTGATSLQGSVNQVNATLSGPEYNRHTMITSSSTGIRDPYGEFPILCPNGSGNSIKLGNNLPGRQAERVSYSFTIPAGQDEYSLIYQYAVVFQDPNHLPEEQPRFTARVYDLASNEYLSCASFDFIATSNLPGFVRSNVTSNVWYKPWTSVTLNLSNYAGRTVILEFTTADCTQGAHFGYAYVDVNIGCTSPVRGATFCPGISSLKLNAPLGYQNYFWYNHDMSKLLGTDSILTITPPPAGNTVYALDIIPFPGFGCRDTVYATIKPAATPVANAGEDLSICYGNTALIGHPPEDDNIYRWFPETGLDNSSVSTTMAKPLTTTNYILTVTNLSTGCVKQDSMIVEVQPQLFSMFNVNAAEQCINNNNFIFTNPNADQIQYEWKFGDGNAIKSFNADYRYNLPGTYTVTLIASSSDCADSTSKDLIVDTLPTGNIVAPGINICEGIPFVLKASGGSSYNWFVDGKLAGSSGTNGFNAIEPGNYTAVIIDQHGCMNDATNSVSLTRTKKPKADFNFDKYCIDIPTAFFNKSTVNNSLPVKYSWDFGNAVQSTQKDTVIRFNQAATFEVKLSVTPELCPQLATTILKQVKIERPIAGLTYVPKNAVESKPLVMKAREIGTTYEWMPSTNLRNTFTASTVFTGNHEQLYKIRITNPSGCTTIDTQYVRIFKEREIYVPNVFTPNNDGRNDRLFPVLVGMRELKVFRIMNRWGKVVFESKTDLPGWDGYYKGVLQPVDGYVWEVQAMDDDGNLILRKGSLTLLR